MRGYRENGTGKAKSKTIKSLGYLEDLEKEYDDPIAHFKEVAKKMTEEENERRKVTITFDMDEELPVGCEGRKNLGYAAILRIYYELELDRFLNNDTRHKGFEYNANSIMTLLVVSRLLSPGSKRKAYEEKGRYFERFDFSLADTYRALSYFATISKELQRHVNERVTTIYGRDTRLVYYDVTNFYFEIDQEDDLRKHGVSKEKRKDPIVQMGLAMDADGVPLHYELFPGNMPDKSTFRSVIGEVRRNYDTGRIIVVGDMGIITGEEKYDGYYSIVTSEYGMTDDEIVETYRGLWEIEETFRITKSDLEARPVYLSRPERIEAHFLTCFLSLVIMRLLQKRTGRKYSCENIVECLNRISCSHEQGNLYLFDYRSELSDAIAESLDIPFGKKRFSLAEIKNLIANTKNS